MGTDRSTPLGSLEQVHRRRVLSFLGAGGAAALATLVPSRAARAGHDGSNVLHLGEQNQAPAGTATDVAADVDDFAFGVLNDNGSDSSGAIQAHSASGVAGWFSTDSGLALQTIGPAAVGADVDNFALGVENANTETTAGGILAVAHGGKPAVEGDAVPVPDDPDHLGVGVQGVSSTVFGETFGDGPGTGVEGISGTGAGVRGRSEGGPGVEGHSVDGPGVLGSSDTAIGVNGYSEDLVGVLGASHTDIGIFGVSFPLDEAATADGVGGFSLNSVGGRFFSEHGIGVRGVSPGDLPAVQAASGPKTDPHFEVVEPDGGLALEVIGMSRFSTAGAGTVPDGQASGFVANPAVTAGSHITVTLTADPGGRQVAWVERNPGVGFSVHLTSAPPPRRREVSFTYLIVEPPGEG